MKGDAEDKLFQERIGKVHDALLEATESAREGAEVLSHLLVWILQGVIGKDAFMSNMSKTWDHQQAIKEAADIIRAVH